MIVSAFGSTEAPTSSGTDPTDVANTIASFVKTYNLDGVDVDYEVFIFELLIINCTHSIIQDFNAINAGDGKAEAWLTTFTQQLRDQLPAGQYLITHARMCIVNIFSRLKLIELI